MLLKKIKKNSLFRFLASLKLAVILLVALAGILATATFYESLYDTKTAQYLVYKSPLFALFLAFLGINLLCSAMMRYPWKKSQTGFVITHLGIIIILLGSLLTMYNGVDGSMALEEGENSKRIMIDEPVLYFGRQLETLREIPAEYRWSPPKPGETEYRYTLEGDDTLVAVIDDYYHHARGENIYIAHDAGLPAVELRLSNENVDQKLWLTPALGEVNLGPASISFTRLPDDNAVKTFTAGVSEEGRGMVQLLLNNNPQVVDLDKLTPGEPFPLEYEGATLELVRYLPHATVENDQLISKSPQPHNPCVELVLRNGKSQQRWLLFAKLPELNSRIGSEGDDFASSLIYNREDKHTERRFELGLTPEGQLLYRVDGGKAKPVKETERVPTGWMNLQAEVLTFHPVAKKEKLMSEVFPKKGQEDKAPGPAIRLTLEGGNLDGPMWLERGDIKKVEDKAGEPVYIGYGYKTVSLPFDVELKDFRVGFDPGTRNAATYESDVIVNGQDHTIAMNEPYEQNGYKVFQASFDKTADGRDISVFSIAHDPGIWMKYVGSILLIVGIIIMFYFKPKKSARPETGVSSHED
ncbi:MAG: cytochrome c biogenesis protein ResB [Candidatus Eremiobacteraeota bacterium]|nr:cytochrome c biogenesis protein ResB [Candidatus Eremiobacteraeota bacterium]